MKASPVVVIHGDESYLADRELAAIETECGVAGPADMNRQVIDAGEKSAAYVINSARTLPFMAGKKLLIIRNAAAWKTADWDQLAAYAEKPNPSTSLVIIAESPDKRRSAWKALQKTARLVDCPRPSDADLYKWASEMARDAGLKISPAVARALVTLVGPDLQLLWREIQKLKAYAGENAAVDEDDVKKLVGETRATNVFALCDALGEKKLKGALTALRKLLELGEPPVVLLYMIARHFRILWKALELIETGRVRESASLLGVPPFVARKAVGQAEKWTGEEMEKAFERFLMTDIALKSGQGAEQLHTLVIRLCGKG